MCFRLGAAHWSGLYLYLPENGLSVCIRAHAVWGTYVCTRSVGLMLLPLCAVRCETHSLSFALVLSVKLHLFYLCAYSHLSWIYLWHSMRMEVRRELVALSSISPPCAFWGLKPGPQVWWQALLLAHQVTSLLGAEGIKDGTQDSVLYCSPGWPRTQNVNQLTLNF